MANKEKEQNKTNKKKKGKSTATKKTNVQTKKEINAKKS
jgi:hypothetical protein